MSRLYDNIRCLCKKKGVRMADIEAPYIAGIMSRYERENRILCIPVNLLISASAKLGISMDDLVTKDLARELKLEEIKSEIARLKEMEKSLERRADE